MMFKDLKTAKKQAKSRAADTGLEYCVIANEPDIGYWEVCQLEQFYDEPFFQGCTQNQIVFTTEEY